MRGFGWVHEGSTKKKDHGKDWNMKYKIIRQIVCRINNASPPLTYGELCHFNCANYIFFPFFFSYYQSLEVFSGTTSSPVTSPTDTSTSQQSTGTYYIYSKWGQGRKIWDLNKALGLDNIVRDLGGLTNERGGRGTYNWTKKKSFKTTYVVTWQVMIKISILYIQSLFFKLQNVVNMEFTSVQARRGLAYNRGGLTGCIFLFTGR